MAIWINNFPLPPSVNQYLQPVAGGWAVSKNGKKFYQKGRLVKTALHNNYASRCDLWARQNESAMAQIKSALTNYVLKSKGNKSRFGFRVDMFFVFHVERIWTVNNLAENLDADNRIKPCRDVLSKLLGIDDKWFFSGFFEKVSTSDKDKECTLIRISPMLPRKLEEIRTQMMGETSAAT